MRVIMAVSALAVAIILTSPAPAEAQATGPGSAKCLRDRAELAKLGRAGETPISCARGGAKAILRDWENNAAKRQQYLDDRTEAARRYCRARGLSGAAFRNCVSVRD